MSIFPKRTVRGKGVTIHWNFNTSHLKGIHLFPYVRIGVKCPDGNVVMLHEGNILALPDSKTMKATPGDQPAYQYLNKNTPLLVLADYLSGPLKKEVLIDILHSIQSGRHYYFQFAVPDNAAVGRYTLISEVHSNGEIRYSKTATDDYFFVEELLLTKIAHGEKQFAAHIENPSTEPIPVKVIQCYYEGGDLYTKNTVQELRAGEITTIHYSSEQSYLLYNEEREIISLNPYGNIFPLRNQQLLSLPEKKNADDSIYVIRKDSEDSYKLKGVACDIWKEADGLSIKRQHQEPAHQQAYAELVQSGLINEIEYNT